jgi:TatD DNase family protein
MLDSHCHLTDPRLIVQLDDVLARAAAAGVTRMLTIGTHLEDWQPCLAVAAKHPNVRCALGIHPNHCREADEGDLAILRAMHDSPLALAVGEMGLDYHYGANNRPEQARYFEAQLQLARDLSKPVIIHCREAVNDTLAILKSFPAICAVFHCFTGLPDEARRIIDAGYFLGFTGVLTYKNAPQLRDIAKSLPPDRILIETDAPYLSPEPMRKQKTNEPSLVIHTAAVLATTLGMNVEEVDRLTTANAERLYGWK